MNEGNWYLVERSEKLPTAPEYIFKCKTIVPASDSQSGVTEYHGSVYNKNIILQISGFMFKQDGYIIIAHYGDKRPSVDTLRKITPEMFV